VTSGTAAGPGDAAGPGAPGGPAGAPVAAARPRRGGRRRAADGRVPWPLALPAAGALAFLLLPLVALLIRAPWRGLPGLLGQSSVHQALFLSIQTATVATGVCVLIGVPLAWVIARSRLPGRSVIQALITLPLVLPPVVDGVALLLAFGRNGVIGRRVDAWFGITLPFTTTGVVVAETFVAMPFLVVSVAGALATADRRYEDAAATLGAGRWLAFRRVTLPMAAPAVAAGAVLCWARALGEFGATITFAGNFPGTTQTMPLAVYLALETDPDAAIALSLLLLAVCVVVLVALRRRWLPGARGASVAL